MILADIVARGHATKTGEVRSMVWMAHSIGSEPQQRGLTRLPTKATALTHAESVLNLCFNR